MAQEKASTWLRIVEIIIGIILIALGARAVRYPGATLGLLVGFLAVGLIVLGCIEFARVFTQGISGWRRLLNLILSIIAILLALAVLINPLIYGTLTLVYLLALALIFAGFASLGRGSPGTIIVGVIAIVLGFVVLVYPPLGLGVAVVLLAVALIIFGLEAIVSGILGRWV